jgi:lysophospholipase L1-like esterase
MKFTICLLLTLLVLAGPHFAAAQSITLVTLGDSLTAGDGDDGSGGGYPTRLLSRLQTTYPDSVLLQFGISGDTTTDLINKQLTPAVNALKAAPETNLKIALVWIGSNDLFGFYNNTIYDAWCSDMGIEACEDSEFGLSADNVSTILEALQATGAVLYIALLDDQSKRPVLADPDLRAGTFPGITDAYVIRMSTRLSAYNSNVQTHANTFGAQTVDFFNTTIFETWATLSDDGNHPNGTGYDAITDIWYNAVTGSSPTPTPNPTPEPGKANTVPILLYLLGSK